MAHDNPALDLQKPDFDEESGGTENVRLEFHEDPKRISEGPLDKSAVGDDHEAGSHSKNNRRNGVLYAVDEIPPWHVTILVGFQHYLSMFCGMISIPFLLSPALCIEETDPARSQLVSTIVFVSGIITLLQCTFGVRLPIVQGGTLAFIIPTFAILSLPEWKCPSKDEMLNMTYEQKSEVWQLRMREVQGAIIGASLFEIAVGAFGIVGLMLRYITPLTITPTIAMLGLSLFKTAGNMAGQHWGVSGASMVLVILFSQYLRHIPVPIPAFKCSGSRKGFTVKRLHLFQVLPLLLTIIIVWALCSILTLTEVLEPKSGARTDTKFQIVEKSPWFSIPYPGQWGVPTMSAAAVIGILAAVLASIVESIGDYYACARLSGAAPPPSHAMNRGIAIEGLGCLLAGIWGSGNGTTSYSGNIGIVGITKVGSRRVIQAAGVMMLFFGIFSKLSAFFVTIPEPIIGGVFCTVFSMITASGLSNLQFVDLNSSRNLFVLGFSTFAPMVISQWVISHPGVIQTGSVVVDQVLTVLLSTTMFVAGLFGFILDNTLPGTPEERGLIEWSTKENITNTENSDGDSNDLTYNLPFITPWLKRQKWATFVPFLPSHKARKLPSLNCCNKNS